MRTIRKSTYGPYPRTRFWELKAKRLGLPDARAAMEFHMRELVLAGKTDAAARVAALLVAGDMPGLVGRGSHATNTAFAALLPEQRKRPPRSTANWEGPRREDVAPMAPIRHSGHRKNKRPNAADRDPGPDAAE